MSTDIHACVSSDFTFDYRINNVLVILRVFYIQYQLRVRFLLKVL